MPRTASLLPRCAILAVSSVVIMLVAARAHAQCDVSQVCIPQPTCVYNSTSTETYGATPIEIRFLRLSNPTACQPPAAPGGNVNSFFDVFFDLQISGDGGGTWQPANGTAHGAIHEVTEASGTMFDTEMLQLDINGGTLPPGVMIRESPTLASTGQETATPESGGMFHIDSFFDIFTELSLDGGQTWTPSSGPSHENIGPSNPTANRASTWGKLKTIYR